METDFHKQDLLLGFEPFIKSDIYFLKIPCVVSPLNAEKYTLFSFPMNLSQFLEGKIKTKIAINNLRMTISKREQILIVIFILIGLVNFFC